MEILRLVPVDWRNRLGGSFWAAAVFQSRAYAPASTTVLSQRGEVDQEYFSFQFWPVGFGIVSLFHGWYGLSGPPAGSVANCLPVQPS